VAIIRLSCLLFLFKVQRFTIIRQICYEGEINIDLVRMTAKKKKAHFHIILL